MAALAAALTQFSGCIRQLRHASEVPPTTALAVCEGGGGRWWGGDLLLLCPVRGLQARAAAEARSADVGSVGLLAEREVENGDDHGG